MKREFLISRLDEPNIAHTYVCESDQNLLNNIRVLCTRQPETLRYFVPQELFWKIRNGEPVAFTAECFDVYGRKLFTVDPLKVLSEQLMDRRIVPEDCEGLDIRIRVSGYPLPAPGDDAEVLVRPMRYRKTPPKNAGTNGGRSRKSGSSKKNGCSGKSGSKGGGAYSAGAGAGSSKGGSGARAERGEEDPTFRVKTDEVSGQTVISGMGELHLDIIMDRLRREFGVDVNQGRPEVAYKEAITTTVQHHEIYKKQTGGKGKFADVLFEIGPADEGFVGLQFINEVKGGNIPKEYMPALEKGFKEAMQNGVLAGYPMDSMKVRIIDGSFHPVDSDQLSFELCAKIGFKAACRKANPVLLEPIMKLEVLTPDAYVGDVTGDLNRRRGMLENITAKVGVQAIHAKVPLEQMFGYVTSLRTITSGRANSTMEFSHYAEVSHEQQEAILKNKNN